MSRQSRASTPRPTAYISGPITRGDRADHVARATQVFGWLVKLGYAPLCPQWSIHAEDLHGVKLPHATWMEIDLAWLVYADLVIRLEGESVGADAETREANELGLPVVYLPRDAGAKRLAELIEALETPEAAA